MHTMCMYRTARMSVWRLGKGHNLSGAETWRYACNRGVSVNTGQGTPLDDAHGLHIQLISSVFTELDSSWRRHHCYVNHKP